VTFRFKVMSQEDAETIALGTTLSHSRSTIGQSIRMTARSSSTPRRVGRHTLRSRTRPALWSRELAVRYAGRRIGERFKDEALKTLDEVLAG
jgi:hypothetical protein